MEQYIREWTQANNDGWLLHILDTHVISNNALIRDWGTLSNVHDQIVRAFDTYHNMISGAIPLIDLMDRTAIYIENNHNIQDQIVEFNEVLNRIIVHHTELSNLADQIRGIPAYVDFNTYFDSFGVQDILYIPTDQEYMWTFDLITNRAVTEFLGIYFSLF